MSDLKSRFQTDRRLLIPWQWLVLMGYAGLIFAISSVPGSSMPEGRFWDFDKLIHAGEFAVLAGLIALALRHSTKLRAGRLAVFAAASSAIYGVSDEVHQSMVQGRYASVYDAMADTAGAAAAALLIYLVLRRRDEDLE